jgi:hypothetical protein
VSKVGRGGDTYNICNEQENQTEHEQKKEEESKKINEHGQKRTQERSMVDIQRERISRPSGKRHRSKRGKEVIEGERVTH